MKKHITLILILLIFSNCAPKQEKIERIIEDGVEVVLNHLEPYKIKGEPIALTLEEEFTIDTERDDLALKGLTEITTFDVDSEGNIYFLNQFSPEIFIFKFNQHGEYVMSFGQKGQGPGELQFPVTFAVNSRDEIWITDQRPTKLVIFNKNGGLVEEKVIGFNAPVIIPLSNEKLLVTLAEYGPKANYTSLVLYSPDFDRIKELSRRETGSLRKGTKFEGIVRFGIKAITSKNIYLGDTRKGYEIWVYDLEGNLERKIRKEHEPVPLMEKYKKQNLERFKGDPESQKRMYFPKFLPPFQFGFADEKGHLFVMTYEKGENPKEYKYDIFNADGIFISRTSLGNVGKPWVFEVPLDAMCKKELLYCVRQKESGYKELVVYKMKWE